jgi:hypothetical protein
VVFARRSHWAQVLALGVLSQFHAAPAAAASFAIADYFPLVPGFAYTYEDADGSWTVTVLSEMQTVNGVPTFIGETSGGSGTGLREFVTNDANGLRIHGGFFPAGSQTPAITLTFAPALLEAPAIAEEGQITPLSGSATVTIGGSGTFVLAYLGGW